MVQAGEEDSLTLATGLGLIVSLLVEDLSLNNIGGILNGSGTDEGSRGDGDGGNGEVVAQDAETSTVGDVRNLDFLTLGVDVGIRTDLVTYILKSKY